MSNNEQQLVMEPTKMTGIKYAWAESIFISLTIYMILFYIWHFVRINYDKKKTKNKCTLVPFLFNTIGLLALLIKFCIDPFFSYACQVSSRVFEYCTGSFACEFYLTAIMIQIYEWDVVRFQIYFQSKLKLS